MGLLELYIIFALATGVCSCLFLATPAIKALAAKNAELKPTVGYTVIFITAVLLAPFFVVLILIPPFAQAFIDGYSGKD